MRLTIISDTHGLHDQVKIEPCDVLIHCGDCTNDAGRANLRNFLQWFEKQDAPRKILIAGNHDWAFEKWSLLAKLMVKEVAPSVTYLEDDEVTIDGVKFYGSPITPTYFDWAFNRERGERIRRYWDMIPHDTNVLITHGPPKGILDWNPRDKFHCGCEDLLNKVVEVSPKLHCFGHIHQGYGQVSIGGIDFINASNVVHEHPLRIANAPFTYDLTA